MLISDLDQCDGDLIVGPARRRTISGEGAERLFESFLAFITALLVSSLASGRDNFR